MTTKTIKKKKTAKKTAAAAGGEARARALTKKRRREIAKKAAEERWARVKDLPQETHTGELTIGDLGIPCSVLDSGQRVFSTKALDRAFGTSNKGTRKGGGSLPPIISGKLVRPFIPQALLQRLQEPTEFRNLHGGRTGKGYEAELLSDICEVLLDARAAGVLRPQQLPVAAKAEILIRSFAKVGIVALIDEATGYQAERDRHELEKILETYVQREFLPWAKRFPDEFFKQVYRIHGWEYDPGNTRRPGYVGGFINKFVYAQLPPGVVEELQQINPPRKPGQRSRKHHQHLTPDIGHPNLNNVIVTVIAAMRLAKDKGSFLENFGKLFDGSQADDFEEAQPVEMPLFESTMKVQADHQGPAGNVTRSPSQAVLDFLGGKDEALTREVALSLYEAAGKREFDRTRKILYRLRDRGLVVSHRRGWWRVV